MSDHIPVWASVARTRSALDTTKGRLRPGPVWEKPSSISVQEWRKLLIATWDSCVAGSFSRLLTILARQNINVHEEWDMFLDCLDLLFLNSFQCLADGHAEQVVRDEALDTLCKPFHNQPKPPLPVFQFVNLDKSSGGSQDDGVSHRKRAKRLARLHEARRLLLANNRSSTHDRQLGVLFHKLWGHRPQGFQTAMCTIRREILDLQREQCCREEARKKARLDKWRQDMREGNLRKLVRWMKGKETEQKAVSIRKGNLVAETRKETLSLIREHWCSVWQARPRSAEAIAETLLQGFPQELQGPRVWQPLTKDQLACAVLNCSGSAGPDAWSAAEVKHLPPQAIDLFFRLTERWISSQTLPRALRFAKQVNLPKDSKVLSDHTLNVESTRPISVLIIWWRIFASAVAKSPALRDWCQEALHDDVTCLAGTPGAEETAATIHEAWVQQGCGFLASLDWSQAYDRMDATATSVVLSGWPEGLTKLMLQAWQHKRFLVSDGEVDSRILESEHALPQGCPLSPVALATWTSSGLRVTNSQLLEDGHQLGKQAVYMDDRTFIGEHWIDISARIQAWKSWSVSVNLRENDNKTQITSRGKDADISQCPENWRKPEVKILGVYSVSKGARACVPEEEARLDKAIRRADLLYTVGLPWEGLLRAGQSAVIGLAAYGWVGRRPTWGHSNRIFNGLTKAHNACRMANNRLRKVLYGAKTHLDIIFGSRLLTRVQKMRRRGVLTWSSNAASQTGLLRRWLTSCDWQEDGPWRWSHAMFRAEGCRHALHSFDLRSPAFDLNRVLHAIRHSWRRARLIEWLYGHRHEPQQLMREHSRAAILRSFHRLNFENIRRFMNQGAAQRAALLGSVVSDSWLHEAGQREHPRCSLCNVF